MHFKVSATDDSGVWISGSISPGPCWAYSTGLRCRDRNLHEEGSRTIVTVCLTGTLTSCTLSIERRTHHTITCYRVIPPYVADSHIWQKYVPQHLQTFYKLIDKVISGPSYLCFILVSILYTSIRFLEHDRLFAQICYDFGSVFDYPHLDKSN